MVQQRHPHQRTPEERRHSALPRPRHQTADQRRNHQRHHRPQHELTRDPADRRVLDQIRRVLVLRRLLLVEHPADMGPPQPLHQRRHRIAEPPRRMRIPLRVRETVMPAVIRHPAHQRPLDRQRPHHRQRELQRPLRLEGTMREMAMETDRDAMAADVIHRHHQPQIQPRDTPAPGQGHRGDQRHKRHRDEQQQRDLLDRPLVVATESGRGQCGFLGLRRVFDHVGACSHGIPHGGSTHGYGSVTYGYVSMAGHAYRAIGLWMTARRGHLSWVAVGQRGPQPLQTCSEHCKEPPP